jgi:hypothetical protein
MNVRFPKDAVAFVEWSGRVVIDTLLDEPEHVIDNAMGWPDPEEVIQAYRDGARVVRVRIELVEELPLPAVYAAIQEEP